jgi:hypothetical protein
MYELLETVEQLLRYHDSGNHKGLSGFLSPGGTDTLFTAKLKQARRIKAAIDGEG